jgi:hypothetical protein
MKETAEAYLGAPDSAPAERIPARGVQFRTNRLVTPWTRLGGRQCVARLGYVR